MKFRRMTKDERMAFGQAHAPFLVEPPGHACAICGDTTTLTLPQDGRRLCEGCWKAAAEWQTVLDMVADFDRGYDPTCGLKPTEEFRRFALAVIYDDLRETASWNDSQPQDALQWAASAYFESIKDPHYKEPEPKMITSSPAEIMERAIKRVVENWKNPSARNLPDPMYQIYQAPGVPIDCEVKAAQLPGQHLSWIIFRHRERAGRIVVATISGGKAEYNSSVEEIGAYMAKGGEDFRFTAPKLVPLNKKNGNGGCSEGIKNLAAALEI